MLQRHLFSHGFTPPIFALMVTVLLDNVLYTRVNAKEVKCQDTGIVKHGFTLKIKDSKARKLLSDANTIKECIALSCKFGGANYAVLENGKCHVINCKKNACELKKDVKSKQRVVSFTRKVKVNLKKNKTQHKKRKYKKTHGSATSTKVTIKQNDAPTRASNWTLAFSTAVVPTNKSNPQLTQDNEFRSGGSKIDLSKIVAKKTGKSVRSTGKSAKKLKLHNNVHRTTVNSKNFHDKIHKKQVKKLSKLQSTNQNIAANVLKGVVHSSMRKTRDYPYSYYQYPYGPSEKSYQTQETDWRRDMIPSSLDSYAAYDSIDKQPFYSTQGGEAAIADQRNLNENNIDTQVPNSELFSLPIASLVRRTKIPGNPHHISSISIVNDMLSDEQNKAYLTDRDNIQMLPSDNRLGYDAGNIGQFQDKSVAMSRNQYSLVDPLYYQPQQQSIDYTNGRTGQSIGQSRENTDLLLGNPINMTGLPLGSFALLKSGATSIPEDQSPTGSPVIIGSDLKQGAPSQLIVQQYPSTNVNEPLKNESSMEIDLTDPVHLAISKEGLASNMKKFTNVSMISNLLPLKEVPAEQEISPPISKLPEVTLQKSYSSFSPLLGSVGTSSSEISNFKNKGAINSFYSGLSDASSRISTLSTTPSVTIFPTASKAIEAEVSHSSVQDLTNIRQGDIDAPVQNAILPVENKEDPYTEIHSGDGQLAKNKDSAGNQSAQNVIGTNMDLPFPSRRKLPEPSKSIFQALSGLSSAVYDQSYLENIPTPPNAAKGISSSYEASSYITAKLTNLPTVTAHFDATNPAQMTSYDFTYAANTYVSNVIQPTLSLLQDSGQSTTIDIIGDWHQEVSNDGYMSMNNTSITQTSEIKQPLPSSTNNKTITSSNSSSVAESYNNVVALNRNRTSEMTHESTGLSLIDGMTDQLKSLNISPTGSGTLSDTLTSEPHVQNSASSITSKIPGHISPESKISLGIPLRHISPIADPRLRISENGSVIVLNHHKKPSDINQIFNQYQRGEQNRAKLKAKRVKWLESGNGCHTPLGLSNGMIADDQITASSYLSPAYAPAKARLGIQKGRTSGWCADPRLNNVTQYLQVDFRDMKNVCRVGMQSPHSTRKWITHYKIAFSLDGRHWSIYKELSKDKVLQGNIEEGDWTSYRLVYPIRTRFIRILPQAWEGNEICTLAEFYTNDHKVNKVLNERSSIPSAVQNVIDDLSFEKVENEIVFDSSPMGNNAFLNKGAAVYDTHGKCRHAARIGEGSDILLDGRNMRVKPRQAISLSVWVRVDRTDGVHSIFDTVGAKSNHILGQYHFEIVGGAVRWFHRDENGTQIFSLITEPNLINPREWNHIVVSYDSETGLAKVYVNGSRVAETTGKGLLSQDWGGRIGLGRHKDTRDLVGDIDEFKIYNEAIQGEKILELSRECDFDKYYCGSILTAERGMLITPDYPALHTGPVECTWQINGMPGEIIAIDVKEFDVNNCNASKLEVRDRDNDSLIGSFCGANKPTRLESHGNQIVVKFISTGSREGERFKVEFHREKKRAAKKTISSVCRNSDLYQNMTLVGGSKAGTFTDLGQTNDMRGCQERCCGKESCEVAFMIDGNCYGVRCFDQERCLMRKAKSTTLNPMLSFIRREGLVPRVVPKFTDVNLAAKEPPPQHIEGKAPPKGISNQSYQPTKVGLKKCQFSEAHYNVTLVRGMKSGNFTSHGVVKDFNDCHDKCCQDGNCDAAFMVKRTCFSISCYDKDSCRLKAARPSPFNPTLAYLIKGQQQEQHEAKVDSSGVSKSTLVESNVCTKSRLSKVYRNVTLRDGINSGEFTDRGSVLNMEDCITQCCGDDNCNLAFVIKDTCFTVKCKSYDACTLKSAVSHYYNPRIAYVNWSPPKDNLGVDNNRYDYRGCWRDFDMSAFAIPLLEGTDPILTGAYKKREDPVNDCATISQHRGYSVFAIQNGGACFSGPNAESTYKRYGPSDACKGGRGGAFANSVYKLFDDGSVMSLGCWGDLQDRAFRRMEKIDDALQDPFVNRADPIGVCSKVAKKHGSKMFALQKGGQCFIGKDDPRAYMRYGPSRKCKYGLGGQMANDVYYIRGANEEPLKLEKGQTMRPILKNTTDLDAIENTSESQNTEILTTTLAPTTTGTTTPTSTTATPKTSTTTTLLNSKVNANALPTTGVNTEATQGTVSQTTIASKSSAKSENISNQRDDVLGTGEVVYKEELTDSEHIKFIYSTSGVMPNETLTEGINAGTFTDKGAIESMDDCVKSCGQTSNCDIAFKLGKQCFGVACYSPDTCHTKPAFSSYYNPEIAIVKHRAVKTLRNKEEHQLESNPTQRSLCKAKNKVENVTLVDGIGAGNFTDLGHVSDMNDCVSRCCSVSTCELAFRIEDDCYGITCYSENSCRTRSARNAMSLKPMIAFVRDIGSRQALSQELKAKVDYKPTETDGNKTSKCNSDLWDGETRHNMTLVGGIGAGDFTDHGQTDSIEECMGYCCENKECDLSFMIDKDCYGVKCKEPSMCKTRPARPTKYRPIIAFKKSSESGFGVMVKPVTDISKTMFKDRTTVDDNADDSTFAARSYYSPLTTNSPNLITTKTTTKTTMTVIPRPPGTTPGFSSTLIKSTSSATPTFADPSTKHSCEAGSIAYNATLKMGMHSGLFTKLGRVAKMDDCIERCCKSSNADVAFMLGSVCFAVKCYSPELCKVAPAMISNIGNLNMNPTLSFLRKKSSSMSTGSADDSSQRFCSDTPITYNVTLKGGIHAGNFTNQGEGLSDRECISKCCEKKSCDLAFMFADLCYSVNCKNEDDCQAVVAKPSNLNPKVSFVSRNRPVSDRGIMFDLSTTGSEDDEVCDEAKLKHSPIMSNKTLAGGLNAGNFTYLGRTSNMKECLGKCCGSKKCDVAYRIDRDCFSVKCFSPELCKVSEAPAKNGFVQIATLTPMDKIKLKTGSIAVYVMLGSVIFTVLISGIGMALCSWRKRKQMKSQHQQTDDTPLPDR